MILDLLAHRWRWPLIGAVLCGMAATIAATKFVGPKFTAIAQLLRYDSPGLSDFFKQDTPMSSDTFAGLIRAPDLLQRVGAKAVPPIPPEAFDKQMKVDADSESDLVSVSLATRNPYESVELLNLYMTNAVNYLRDAQAQQIRTAADSYLGKQVAANGPGHCRIGQGVSHNGLPASNHEQSCADWRPIEPD